MVGLDILIPLLCVVNLVTLVLVSPIFTRPKKDKPEVAPNTIMEITKHKESKAKIYGVGRDNAGKNTG